MPHHATHAVVAACAIVMALQTIISRNVSPLHTGIITVGAFIAGDALNAILDVAELRLTVHAFRLDVRGPYDLNDSLLSTGAGDCVRLAQAWLSEEDRSNAVTGSKGQRLHQ